MDLISVPTLYTPTSSKLTKSITKPAITFAESQLVCISVQALSYGNGFGLCDNLHIR